MPYIHSDLRIYLDSYVEELHHHIVEMELDDEETNTEDNVKYAMLKLLTMVYGNKDSTTSRNINDALGVLESVKLEFFHKVARPYEDQRCFENGDVEPFTNSTPEIVGEVTITDSTQPEDNNDGG